MKKKSGGTQNLEAKPERWVSFCVDKFIKMFEIYGGVIIIKYTKSQQEAIQTLDKNLQIIACAGSGKTQVISQRILNILKSGVEPKKIIAFTYTEKAAGELQARILKMCREQLTNIQGLAEMYIGTIHSWCLNVLQDYKYEYQKFSVLDEIKLRLFVDKNFNTIGMKELDMERFKDTRFFIQLMGMLREAEFTGEIPKELIIAKGQYEKVLKNYCYLDFTMIMTEALYFIQNDEKFKEKIKAISGYLIVDEYQDVNPIQENLIKELYKFGSNVCVVGDDDQTIFQWRGSHIDYIQQFDKRYENVKSVILNDNFRSSKAIIDVALKTISHNNNRLTKEMVASGFQEYKNGDILFNEFESIDNENKYIAEMIKKMRGIAFKDKQESEERGLEYSDFVILIRKWKKAEAISKTLQEKKIPFIVTGVNNLFLKLEIQAAKMIYLYLAREVDKGTLFSSWKALSSEISEENLNNAIELLEKNMPTKSTYYETFNLQGIFLEFLDKAGVREELFCENENEVIGYSKEEIIFYNFGMFSQIINDFETIYYSMEPEMRLNTFLNFLKYSAEDYYPEGWLNNSYKTPNAVQIMTIYQSKGLEYPVVFIPGLNKNYMPTSQPTGKQVWHFIDKNLIKDSERYFPSTEDERRLMYVAITRAKKHLIITRSPDGKMQGKESIFCKEARESDYTLTSKEYDYTDRVKNVPKASNDASNITLNFSLLKSFFDCPYSFKFYSFYGFQSPLGARMGYGKSIHNSLMELHREYLDGNKIDKNGLKVLLEKHIHFPYATKPIIESMTNRANEALNIYYEKSSKEFDQIEFAEKEIQIDLGEGILVNGKMDLIKKKNNDGSFENTIIDFKSSADASVYNATIDQLQLYALGYKELTGESANFLEIYNLDENDRRRNLLSSTDLSNMKEKIIKAANEIRENHLDKTCNKPECVCRFKNKI